MAASSLADEVNFFKTQQDTTSQLRPPADNAPMIEWALYYARLGLKVIPGHNPLFDDAGNCVGCTCEAYKRSEKYHKWLIEKGRGREFDPNYKCKTPGKHPRFANWQDRATSDEKAIRQWWGWWPDANVGHNPGKAEFGPERRPLIMLDGDSYKDTYEGGDLALPSNTPTALTGNLGEHDYFYMPHDKAYGQHTGDLPAGIDIRGVDGYDILPPSKHYSGRCYQWEADLSFADLAPLELPQHVINLMESYNGQKGVEIGPSNIEAVRRSAEVVEALLEQVDIDHAPAQAWGDGRRWILHDCPFNPTDDPHGADGASFIVVYQDGRIGAGCHHNRCQHVIQDSGLSGWALLKEQSGHQEKKGYTEFDDYCDWVQAARGTVTLKERLGSVRVEGPRKVLSSLAWLCRKQGTNTISIGNRRLGEMCGMSHAAVGKILKRLAAGGFLQIEEVEKGKLPQLTLAPYAQVSTYSFIPEGHRVETYDQGRIFYRVNAPDDAYLSGHGAYKKRRREMGLDDGMSPMGPAALLVAAHLRAYGQMSRTQLQTSTGLGQGAITTAIRRLIEYGQIEAVATGPRRTNIYALTDYASVALEALRPGMQTHTVGLSRRIQNLEIVLARWHQRYPNRRTLPDDVRRKLLWMEELYEKLTRQHPATVAYLHRREKAEGGERFNAGVSHNVRHHRRFTENNRFDRGEEWATHKPAYEAYQGLVPLPHKERLRLLGLAGWTTIEVKSAIFAAARLGRGERQFEGVGEVAA